MWRMAGSPAMARCRVSVSGRFGMHLSGCALRCTSLHGDAEEGVDSELEVFLDGKSLCGIRFPANVDVIPQ